MCQHNGENWDCPDCEADAVYLNEQEVERRAQALREEGFRELAESLERVARKAQEEANKK